VAWLSKQRPERSGFVPDSGCFDPVSGFAFFVEIAAIDVVYHREGEVLDFGIL